jgi:hypothetical protein
MRIGADSSTVHCRKSKHLVSIQFAVVEGELLGAIHRVRRLKMRLGVRAFVKRVFVK